MTVDFGTPSNRTMAVTGTPSRALTNARHCPSCAVTDKSANKVSMRRPAWRFAWWMGDRTRNGLAALVERRFGI